MRDLNELQIFTVVGQTESFTQAASRLSMTKSAVSRAVASLERRVGVALLTRTTRTVTLTEVGAVYLSQCERMLEEADRADQLIGQLQAVPRGALAVSAPVAFTQFILGPLIPEFLARYPEIELRMHLSHGGAMAPADQFDVQVRPGPLEDSSSYSRFLTKTDLNVYATESFLERHPVDEPNALARIGCVVSTCSPQGDPSRTGVWTFRQGGSEVRVKIRAKVSVADPLLNLKFALAGTGPALIGSRTGERHVASGELVRLLPGWTVEPVELYAIYSSRLNSSPRVRSFVDFLTQRLQLSGTEDARATAQGPAQHRTRSDPKRGKPVKKGYA